MSRKKPFFAMVAGIAVLAPVSGWADVFCGTGIIVALEVRRGTSDSNTLDDPNLYIYANWYEGQEPANVVEGCLEGVGNGTCVGMVFNGHNGGDSGSPYYALLEGAYFSGLTVTMKSVGTNVCGHVNQVMVENGTASYKPSTNSPAE